VSGNQKNIYVDEVEQICKDGSTVWTEVVTRFARNERGELIILGVSRDITARRKAEQILRESEARYRSLFEDSPVAMWEEDFSEVKKILDRLKQAGITDFRSHFYEYPEVISECQQAIKELDVNQAALKMVHASSKDELINNITIIYANQPSEEFIEILTRLSRGYIHWDIEVTNQTLDKKPIILKINWSVVPGYEKDFSKVIITKIDITEKKRTEELIRQSEEKFRKVFQTSPDPISITRLSDGTFLELNQGFLDTFGYEEVSEVQGKSSLELNVWADAEDRKRFVKQLQEKGSVRNFESQFQSKDGQRIYVMISATLIDV
jgi:PAS domain S-box-containing protein